MDKIKQKENGVDLQKAREKMNLTREQAALLLEMSVANLRLLEKGLTKNPKPETRKKIEALYGKDD